MTRPATFTCAWCKTEKTLARTGRMPRFCSDWCRRQPEAAQRNLDTAVWQRDSAIRQIAYWTEKLESYGTRPPAETPRSRDAGVTETIPAAADDENGSRVAIAAERRTA